MNNVRKTQRRVAGIALTTHGGFKSNEMVVEEVPISSIKERPKEVRKISERAIGHACAMFSLNGQPTPILTEDDHTILAGHEFLLAAKRLGWTTIKVIRLSQLSKDEARILAIGLARLPQLSDWDDETLKVELADLVSLDLDVDVLDLVGFNQAEFDVILEDNQPADEPNPLDDVPPAPNELEAVTRPGDLWLLGGNALICGNALISETFVLLLRGNVARQMLTDPPWNVVVEGNVSGLGKVKHKNFAMACGEMSPEQFKDFNKSYLTFASKHLMDGALAYVFMDRRTIEALYTASREANYSIVDLAVWDKGSGGMGSYLRSQLEPCLILKFGKAPFLNNVQLGKWGRYRTNVWKHRGLSSFGKGREETLRSHPTSKPVNLLAEAIKDCTKRGDIVLDPFLGSGSTLLAAEKTGRRCYGIELEPRYVDVAIERWQQMSGKPAILDANGRTFEEVRAERIARQTDIDQAGMQHASPDL